MKLVSKLSNIGLPLLMKELHEQSARTRTFVLRFVYAVLLILGVGLANLDALFQVSYQGVSVNSNLGLGKQFFVKTLGIQIAGIYLFLPAIVCGVLTVEKERNTLGLLLITKLNPWTIIIEKFASRILPMLTFLLISLPLMSFMYSLGGLEPITLFLGIWFLLLSVLQIASLAVLASSFFSGTVGAFLGTYALILILSFGPLFLDIAIFNTAIQTISRITFGRWLQWMFGDTISLELFFGPLTLWLFVPPALLEFNMQANGNLYGMQMGIGGTIRHPYLFALLCGFPTLVSTGISLALARFFLIRRAFVTTTNPILSLFKWMDRIFVTANQRFARGVVLVKESQSLPDQQPVAWRETAKRSLGQFRYLVRVFVTLEVPTLLLVFLFATGPSGYDAQTGPVSALMFALWMIAVVLIAVTASNLISNERSRQTLDVLLTTPLTSRDIILQKLRGVRRLMLVCAVPVVTCIIFQTWWRQTLHEISYPDQFQVIGRPSKPKYEWIEYLVTTLAGVIILFHLVMWLAFWIGMKMKSPSKAIITSLAVLVAWCALPAILTYTVMAVYAGDVPIGAGSEQTGVRLWFLTSPAFLVTNAEFVPFHTMTPIPYLPVLLNSLIYGGCCWLLRYRVLSRADDGLTRMPTTVTPI